MMCNVEDKEEVNSAFQAKNRVLEKDINFLKEKISKQVEQFSKLRIERQNYDATYKRILAQVMRQSKLEANRSKLG